MTASRTSSPPQERIPFHRSIRFRLIVIIFIISILPLATASLVSYWQAHRLLSSQVKQQMATAAQIAGTRLDEQVQLRNIRLRILFNRGHMAEEIGNGFAFPVGSAEQQAIRTTWLNAYEAIRTQNDILLFDDILVASADGQVHYASQPAWEGKDLRFSRSFDLLKTAPPGTYILPSFDPLYPDRVVLATTYKKFSADNNLEWIGVAFSSGTSIASLLRTAGNFHPQAYAYFVSDLGEHIGVDRRTLEIFIFSPSQDLPGIWDDFLATGEVFHPNIHNADGIPTVAYLYPLQKLNTNLVLELPRAAVFGQLDALSPIMFSLGILAVIITLGVAISVGQRLSTPILQLAAIQQAFAAGDFARRAPENRNDELGLLARTFNQMATELSALYQGLEQRVQERTNEIRTAAEIAQEITSSQDLQALLQKTAALIATRFGYYHVGIFLLNPTGEYAQLQAAYGPAAETMLEQTHRLPTNEHSIVGWVSKNVQARIVNNVENDPIHFKNPLLPQTRSETAIPIALGDAVFGVLDVQSDQISAFHEDAITTLQIIANQLASAIYNLKLRTFSGIDLALIDRLTRASYRITQATTSQELEDAIVRTLHNLEYAGIWLHLSPRGQIQNKHAWNPLLATPLDIEIPTRLLNMEQAETLMANGTLDTPLKQKPIERMPRILLQIARQLETDYAIFVPVFVQGHLHDLLIFGYPQAAPEELLRTAHTIGLAIGTSWERIRQQADIVRKLRENEAIMNISRLLTSAPDLDTLFRTLHQQVQQTLGDYAFLVALYDGETNSIRIPYLYENGAVSSLPSYPLGEGLTSIVLRSRQPLLLVEDTARQAEALGAKVVGEPARSWLGVPLIANEQPIGAIVVQDLENEGAFTEDDMHLLQGLADSIAGVLQNIRLLDESRQRTLEVQTAAEIARDISQAINLDDLLQKAVALIPQRLNFYHAAIFLLDATRQYAVIREGTGEVGLKMKRMGHRLGVGSRSTVGYASSRGEMLVINDTQADATHRPNPLLPDTRAEAAIPLKVGERIIGVLDVQSTEPYTFTPDKLRTLQILADQLAIAIENAELFARMQENLSQQRLLHNITAQATGGTSIEDALDMAVQGLQVTLGGDRVSIMLLDARQQVLRVAAARGYSEQEIRQMVIPVGRGIIGWAVQTRQTVRVDDTTKDPRYIALEGAQIYSELAIPLIYRNEVLGVLNVESELPNAYDNETTEMLETMASNLAAIIANARLVERIRRQANRQRMLYEAAVKLRRTTTVDAILRTTAEELTLALNARRAEIRIQVTPDDTAGEEQ